MLPQQFVWHRLKRGQRDAPTAGPVSDKSRLTDEFEQFQTALIELSRSGIPDLNLSLHRISEVAAGTLNVDRVSISLFNDEHTELHFLDLYDRKTGTHESGLVLEVSRYPRYFEAMEHCRVIPAHDAVTHPDTNEFARGYLDVFGIGAMLDVPIRLEGRNEGVLCNEHVGGPRQWTLDEQNFAASLADLTALMIETDRRRNLERELRRSFDRLELYNKRLKLLQQTDRAILSARSVSEIADAALARFFDLVPCKRASVSVFEPERGVARLAGVLSTGSGHAVGVGGEIPLASFGDLEDLRQGRPYLIGNLEQATSTPARAALEADGIRSLACVPLVAAGELIGTLNAGWAEPDAFTPERIEIAQEVCDSLAVAIRHAHLNQQVAKHALELEKRVAERTAELSASEERVRALYDNTPVMMQSVDVNARLVDVNQFWLKKMGYEKHEVIGKPIADFAAPENRRAVVDEMIPRLFRDGFVKDLAVEGVKKNGERIDILLSSVVRRDAEGNFLHTQAFLLDVTEHKRAERARRETEERLAGILRSAMDAIVAIDRERHIVVFNEAAEKVFRCPAASIVGRSVDAFLSEPLRQMLVSYINDSNAATQLWVPVGMRATRHNGESFPIEATVARTEVSTGRLFTMILRDVNEREQAQQMLDHLQRQNIYLQEELQNELNFEEIVGASPAMQKVFQAIEMVAETDSTVLLLGETGTGKELIARALHNRSRRKHSVMVKVNCGALPASLVESELFGHERGAFTGAVGQKKGRFELAHRGTIFLDETGELPLETQAKLLRVLQEQEFERVGGAQTVKVDVRVIGATNRDLEAEVRRGAFRPDLFYRLHVFPIEVPPLRERKDDIPLLVNHFVRKFAQRMGRRIHSVSRAVHDQMIAYEWPGNVRELGNMIERAVILCQDDVLQPKHLSMPGRSKPTAIAAAAAAAPEGGVPTLEEGERRLILKALEQCNGVLAGPNGAAAMLGINRSTLWSRMRKLGIDAPKGKAGATS